MPHSTLWNKVNKRHEGNPGHPTLLSEIEEQKIVHTIDILTRWKEPMDKTNMKLFIKTYLDKKGALIQGFKDNYPGDNWIALFMKCHNLTQEICRKCQAYSY